MRPPGPLIGRPSALTTPCVTVKRSPKGLPMAMAIWPGTSARALPSGAADGGVQLAPVREGHGDPPPRLVGLPHDVLVGEDISMAVDDYTGAFALGFRR